MAVAEKLLSDLNGGQKIKHLRYSFNFIGIYCTDFKQFCGFGPILQI